jgi:hypothetical protein
LYGSNCNLPTYTAPVALVLNSTSSYFSVMEMGEQLPVSVRDALGAGPNLGMHMMGWVEDDLLVLGFVFFF